MPTILLVDDHKIMRDGLRVLLEFTGEFRVAGEAESGTEAIHLAASLKPQLVLMDISLPGISGIEATIEILRHSPGTRVVILSMYDDEKSVVSALRAGARAFVLKKASHNELLDALRTVASGGSYLSAEVSDKFFAHVQHGTLSDEPASALSSLTPRELQVMRLIASGKSSKEVAVELELGLETVRGYRKALMRKLGVNNVAALTQIALSTGLASPLRLGATTA